MIALSIVGLVGIYISLRYLLEVYFLENDENE
jgi:hypothetical protein